MRPSRRVWAVVAVGLVLVFAAWWFGLVRQNYGVALTSRSMSHSDENLPGVLDPGEQVSVEPVLRRADVVTAVEGRGTGYQVASDWGDVISFEARHRGEGTGRGIVHRAIAWVEYNASADAYDVPDLGVRGAREFAVPEVGTWNEYSRQYVHMTMWVVLDPDQAGRHDGFLTKGDHNPTYDQAPDNGLSGIGDVHLVAVADIDGKVADWLEPHESLRTALWAFGAAGALGAAWVLFGRKAMRGGLAAKLGRPACASCGKGLAPDASFCVACGADRPK